MIKAQDLSRANTFAAVAPKQDVAAADYSITELVLANEHPQQLALLLPMIAHLSHSCEQRWVTWIAPSAINRELLERSGVNLQRIRLIHSRTPADARWIAWEALAAGTSHCVIATLGRMTEKELSVLEQAAHTGRCQGLLLRTRQTPEEWQANGGN